MSSSLRLLRDFCGLSAHYLEEFCLRDEWALRPFQTAAAIAKQVAFAKKLLCSRFVENDLRIHGRSHPEANLQREVGFDRPGNDISVGALSSK
jgi:hypothetical protein